MAFPTSTKYVVIGAGIHGLSTAFHLALELKSCGRGSGEDILVVDKTSIGAGASGIACGVIRNNYFQPAMRELMAHSVSVWESDPEKYHYHPVGYMQISPECMREDVASIAEQQEQIGYESVFVEGAKASADYMRGLFDDWQAQGITSVLHEKPGGYANNTSSLYGLADKAEAEGVRILTGVAVTGFESANGSDAISAVLTERGPIECDFVVVAAGPWATSVWEMLGAPRTVTIKGSDGTMHDDIPMWVFWSLQEGTLGVDPDLQKTNDGNFPPVIHVDSDAPLLSDIDGSLITEQMWGIYYKPDFHFGGIQGGAALAHCQKRFSGQIGRYKNEPSGGIGAFTPDSFPVFDVFRENCYVIADSNHGFKMIGVGKLAAGEICGTESELLKPFRYSRYAAGKLHPVSNSPFPWS